MISWSFLQGLDIYSWQVVTALIISGFLVGFINHSSRKRHIISFSLFMGLGLPANFANGTIRLGVVLQTLAATLYFKKNNFLALKKRTVARHSYHPWFHPGRTDCREY